MGVLVRSVTAVCGMCALAVFGAVLAPTSFLAPTSVFVPTAGAAQLTCDAAPGTSVTAGDGVGACAAQSDPSARSLSVTTDGVAFASATQGAGALGAGMDGGVGAAEAVGGLVAAMAFGADSVSIVSADPGALAVSLATPGAQSFVGTFAEGVECRGVSVALNFTTGQGCLSDGVSLFLLPASSDPASSDEEG